MSRPGAGPVTVAHHGTIPASLRERRRAIAVVGVVTDPDLPIEVGSDVARELTTWLGERTGDEWNVETRSDPVAADTTDSATVFDELDAYRDAHGWDYAVCVTDLPLLLRDRAMLAESARDRGLAIVSLPALGVPATRRLRNLLQTLFRELLADDDPELTRSRRATARRLTVDEAGEDVRYAVNRVSGWLRLVIGMVVANRPWRLIFGLSSALAAALATSAFGLSSSTIWQIADMLEPYRRAIAAVISVLVLVVWLIAAHRLWERPKNRQRGYRRLAPIYNLTMVLTLLTGVLLLYGCLFVVNMGVATLLVPSELVSSTLGKPASVGTYLSLAWGFTTLGVLAGAVGSSLESDEVVRQVAYGYREQQRRREREDSSQEESE